MSARAARRIRAILEPFAGHPIRLAAMGSDADPHLALRSFDDRVTEADTVHIFWPRWEPRETDDWPRPP